MIWFWDHYVPNHDERVNPYAAPLRATELSGLPPAYILTAEYDVLRDEAESYGEKLQAAGVKATTSRYDGVIHGFLRRHMFFDRGKAALDEVSKVLRDALGT